MHDGNTDEDFVCDSRVKLVAFLGTPKQNKGSYSQYINLSMFDCFFAVKEAALAANLTTA